jgi:Flp pilus assembly pilin Flp
MTLGRTMWITRHGLGTLVGGSARRFARDCSGTTAIEYVILTFIAVAIIAIVSQVGGNVNALYERVVTAFSKF